MNRDTYIVTFVFFIERNSAAEAFNVFDKPHRGPAKGLMPLPGQHTGCRKLRIKRPAADFFLIPEGNRTFYHQGISQAPLNHDRPIGGKIAFKQNLKALEIITEPVSKLILYAGTAGHNNRLACQIPGRDKCLFCQRIVGTHQYRPSLFYSETVEIILVNINRFQQKADINGAYFPFPASTASYRLFSLRFTKNPPMTAFIPLKK